jgi:hypothetical protein
MNASEPRTRHRGYFLSHADTDSDGGENESPEGVTSRIRITRAGHKRQAGGGSRAASTSHRRRRTSHQKTTLTIHAGQDGPVK